MAIEKDNSSSVVPVTNIVMDSTLELNIGESKTLAVTVSPENADNKGINWSSSDSSVAAVNADGKINGIKAGTAIITAKVADGSGILAICTVTVKTSSAPGSETTIKVSFELIGDSKHDTPDKHKAFQTWIQTTNVSVPKDSTVYNVFDKALQAAGIQYTETQPGYIGKIKSPAGFWLGEFDNGPNSGWMYTVNGIHPLLGLMEFKVNDGDIIIWHYTDDYTKEEGSEKWNSRGGPGTTSAADTSTKITAVLDSKHIANGTISGEALTRFVEAIANGADKAGNTAAITVDTPKGAAGVKTKLPQEVIAALKKTENTALKIETGIGNIIFDAKALQTMVTAADKKEITLAMSQLAESALSDQQKDIVKGHPVFDLSIQAKDSTIKNFGGGEVAVTIPYTLKENEKADHLTVYYLGDNNEMEKMEDAKYDAELKALVFTTGHFSKFAIVYEKEKETEIPEQNLKFTDVSGWAEEYIYYLANRGIVNGKTKTTFAPNDNITRAEFAAILARMSSADMTKYTTSSFSDVKDSDWYCPAAAWANANKVAQGYDGKFSPNNQISRQDMAVMITNYAENVAKYTMPKTHTAVTFADDGKIAGYAKNAVSSLQQAGIISGQGDNMFAPIDHATRAEAAKMITVLLQGIKE